MINIINITYKLTNLYLKLINITKKNDHFAKGWKKNVHSLNQSLKNGCDYKYSIFYPFKYVYSYGQTKRALNKSGQVSFFFTLYFSLCSFFIFEQNDWYINGYTKCKIGFITYKKNYTINTYSGAGILINI